MVIRIKKKKRYYTDWLFKMLLKPKSKRPLSISICIGNSLLKLTLETCMDNLPHTSFTQTHIVVFFLKAFVILPCSACQFSASLSALRDFEEIMRRRICSSSAFFNYIWVRVDTFICMPDWWWQLIMDNNKNNAVAKRRQTAKAKRD